MIHGNPKTEELLWELVSWNKLLHGKYRITLRSLPRGRFFGLFKRKPRKAQFVGNGGLWYHYPSYRRCPVLLERQLVSFAGQLSYLEAQAVFLDTLDRSISTSP